MSVIVNVRGTNGSGKSTVSRRLRDEHQHELRVEPVRLREKNFKKPNVTLVQGGLVIVGREKSGCDGIYPQEIVEDMLQYWAERSQFMVWENVLVSGNIGRWGRLAHAQTAAGHRPIWACLDTPLETCIERVYARRAEAAARGFKHRQGDAGVNEEVIAGHWRRCRRSAARAAHDEGLDVRWIQHAPSYEMVHDMLVRAGWECPHGLLRPDLSLDTWRPTDAEYEGVIKSAWLPWEEGFNGVPAGRKPTRERAAEPARRGPEGPPEAVSVGGTIEWDPLTELGDAFDN